jgi:hypothetical protein
VGGGGGGGSVCVAWCSLAPPSPLTEATFPARVLRATWWRACAAVLLYGNGGVPAEQGLTVESVSKVPYLCRGDGRYPFYILYDAVLVCRASPAGPATPGAAAGGGRAVGRAGGDDAFDFSPVFDRSGKADA